MDEPLAEDREFAMLEAGQISTLNAVERMGATLSLFGILLIFITFAYSKRLRTIPNTFIFFASLANVGACVACLIAYDGIQAMSQDRNAALCQAQAFMFEWFMQSDPWWSFAMAVNVYMVFFMSFNPTTFRQYLWIYCVICFGLPSIPAFVFLFVRQDRGLVYGDAARNQLRNLSLSNQAKDDEDATCESPGVRDSAEKNLTVHPGQGYYGTVTTEVQVTSATIPTTPNPFLWPPDVNYGAPKRSSDTTTPQPSPSREGPPRNAPGGLSPIQSHSYPWSCEPSAFNPGGDVALASPITTLVNSNDSSSSYNYQKAPLHGRGHHPVHNVEHNFEHTGFGGATQSTTISAGLSNMSDVRDLSPTRIPSPMMSTTTRTTTKNTSSADQPEMRAPPAKEGATGRKKMQTPNLFQRLSRTTEKFRSKLRHMDPVKLAYLRTSFVFAISVLVTWTPSSINRVYTLIYPERSSWGLNIAAAVVLPLQGVWNAVIYFTTSWKIFREEMEMTRAGRRVLESLRLDSSTALARQSGSFALASSLRTPRSEMGRGRRLEPDGYFENDVELLSPTRTQPQRPRQMQRSSTIRVMRKGLEDFS
ncbi:hypothetical protein SLS53_008429 [Cytospora paraplurivora]|uniref:G-protein coupled receptors family 2 profile 2 domain-containing protein n=1 Tax=Cytospora paraplurivora TaxID=2898453 RepID=A0AAN9YC62_9PEZI